MIEIITESISQEKLKSFLGQPFDEMVKFVVDVEKEIIALGGEMHADAEEILLEQGSEQKKLWGANVYPDKQGDDRLEYVSLINIRPSQGNRAMEIQDETLQQRMRAIALRLLFGEL